MSDSQPTPEQDAANGTVSAANIPDPSDVFESAAAPEFEATSDEDAPNIGHVTYSEDGQLDAPEQAGEPSETPVFDGTPGSSDVTANEPGA